MQTTLTAEIQEGIDRAIKRYYSHRPADIDEARQAIEEAIRAGKVDADVRPADIVNIVCLGAREEEYLIVRALALQVLRSPERVGTTSNSEGLACALLFGRGDWLGNYSWAGAAERVGPEWLKAVVRVEDDFKWLRPAISLFAAGEEMARAERGNGRKIS
jgi:hypothetical protein